MRLTEPTRATREHIRRKDATTKALHKFVRSKGGRWRKRLHSPAAERGATRLRREVGI